MLKIQKTVLSKVEKSDSSAKVTHRYRIYSETPLTENEVLSVGGLPSDGQLLPGSSSLRVKTRSAERKMTKNGEVWDVDVNYDVQTSSAGSSSTGDTSSLSSGDLIDFSIEALPVEIPVEKAKFDGTENVKVQNTAGMAFDPPLTEFRYNTVLKWSQIESSYFRPYKAMEYINSINSKSITILDYTIPKFCGLLRNIEPRRKQSSSGRTYWEVSYEIEINSETHLLKVRNQGFRHRVKGELKDILKGDINPDLKTGSDSDKSQALEPISEPADPDESGTLLADGKETICLEYQTKEDKNWNSFFNFVKRIG